MASFNRVIIAGNVTRAVELKFTQSEKAVTEVGVAINSKRKNQTGQTIEEVVFVDVTLWGRTAEVANEYLRKGSSVLIEGRLKLDTWETDGQKRSKLRVVGERMQMLSAPGGGNATDTRPDAQTDVVGATPEDVPLLIRVFNEGPCHNFVANPTLHAGALQ